MQLRKKANKYSQINQMVTFLQEHESLSKTMTMILHQWLMALLIVPIHCCKSEIHNICFVQRLEEEVTMGRLVIFSLIEKGTRKEEKQKRHSLCHLTFLYPNNFLEEEWNCPFHSLFCKSGVQLLLQIPKSGVYRQRNCKFRSQVIHMR